MSGRRVKATHHPAQPPVPRPRAATPEPPAKAAPRSPQARAKRSGGAAADDSRQDALAEARDLAAAVANADEGINNTTPPASPPYVPRKEDSTVRLDLNKEKTERAKLQAETERLRKELDDLVK